MALPCHATSSPDSLQIYIDKYDYVGARNFANRFCEKAWRNKEYLSYTKCLIAHAEMYVLVNDPEASHKLLFEGLRKVEQANLLVPQVMIRNRIGAIFAKSESYRASMKYMRSAWQLSLQTHNDSLISRCEQSIFYSYLMMHVRDSSKYFSDRIYKYAKKTKDNSEFHRAHTNICAYYFEFEEYDIGKKYLDSSVYYANRTANPQIIEDASMNAAAFYVKPFKNYAAAKKIYDKYFQDHASDTTSSAMANFYHTYSEILEKTGHPDEAITYLNKAIAIKEKAYAADRDRLVWNIESKYKIKKIEDGFAKKNKIMLIILAVLILTLILFYFYMQNTRLKQKNKLQLLQNETQQQILGATLDGQETERHKIAGVLHDNISAMLSSASLQLSAFSAGNPDKSAGVSKVREIIGMAHETVRELSHELVPVLLSKFGLAYAVNDLSERNSTDTLSIKAQMAQEAQKRFDAEFEMKVFFITSELINNVVKHSKATEAFVKIGADEGQLSVVISDNGNGFSSDTSSDGFGLTQIKARVAAMKGKINIDSKPGAGTSIHISLPIPLAPLS
ncbi:sensor histidine kinase [Flavobacterium silvaticum]|uniref:Oxygen sensor histidine kinase NreB n=1 Tax=Flavobacterium silvaticum TaxID=1852020 RepID=A0A972FRS5_9FLAO|nr:sensor histidine kinase [Flavobacterium silvaticum]NMH27308.1 sensor histidine kinase [Flavobacterium silvaticum]